MHLDPRAIAHDFDNQSTNHGSEVGPCAIAYTQKGLHEEEQGKNGEVESIASQGWIIANLSEFQRAELEGAEVDVNFGDGLVDGHDADSLDELLNEREGEGFDW